MRRPAELLIFFFLIQVTSKHTTPSDLIRSSSKFIRVPTTKSLQISFFIATSLLLGFLMGKVYARLRRGESSKIKVLHKEVNIRSKIEQKSEKLGKLVVNHKYEKNF